MSISLKRIQGAEIFPIDDARMFKRIYTRNAIFEGCQVSIVATNQLHITSGTGVIQGGEFNILGENFLAQLPTTLNGEGKAYGIVYIKIDLSNVEEPVSLETLIYEPGIAPTLTQNENLYEESGIYEIPICKYTANLTSVTSIGQNKLVVFNYPYKEIAYDDNVFSVVEDIFANKFIDSSPAFTLYNSGDYRMHNGLLYRYIGITGSGQSSFDGAYWKRVQIGTELVLAKKPATVGAGTTVATSLTAGQVFTAPSDGVYQIKTIYSVANSGFITTTLSNGQTHNQIAPGSSGYTITNHIPVNAGQILTITGAGSISTVEVKFFPQYA